MNNRRMIAIGLVTAVFLSFQNCGQVSFQALSDLQGLSGPRILINSGATYTNSMNVQVTASSQNTVEMYITNDSKCASGGTWVPQQTKSPWVLGQTNQEARVFGKFRTKRQEETDCVEARIVHDDIGPTIQFMVTPATLSATGDAEFEMAAQDNLSGLDHLECRMGADPFVPCTLDFVMRNLADAPHSLEARAVDRAGNMSPDLRHDWLIDTTPPTVQITKMPAALSNSTTAMLEFAGSDSGSGVKSYACQIDLAAVQTCSSPMNYTSLTSSTHKFSVWAVDMAGNTSAPATYDFTVDNVPPGSFTVLGVTAPPNDTKVDSWLRGFTPTVYWTASAQAVSYKVSILNSALAVVCAAKDSTATTYAFVATDCTLADLTGYKAFVVAVDSAGNETPSTGDFIVDTTPPNVAITGPDTSANPQTATLHFNVSDTAPGMLDTVICYRIHAAQTVQQSCDGLNTITYTNLDFGDHTFRIIATDKAGNQTTQDQDFKVTQVICNPFAAVNGDCKGGLVGSLYYLDASQQVAFKNMGGKSVQYIIDNGHKVDAQLKFTQLFVPTRQFDQGFPSSSGNTIKDNAGATLIEYFAMDLFSYIHLDMSDPTNPDQPGDYEFALISDDGSLLKVKNDANSQFQIVLNNDGDHATKMGCSTNTVAMAADVGRAIQLQYYQGPRTEIAVTVMWRKVLPGEMAGQDPLCGLEDTNAFFGRYPYNDFTTSHGYGQLGSRGWKVLGAKNFVAP